MKKRSRRTKRRRKSRKSKTRRRGGGYQALTPSMIFTKDPRLERFMNNTSFLEMNMKMKAQPDIKKRRKIFKSLYGKSSEFKFGDLKKLGPYVAKRNEYNNMMKVLNDNRGTGNKKVSALVIVGGKKKKRKRKRKKRRTKKR